MTRLGCRMKTVDRVLVVTSMLLLVTSYAVARTWSGRPLSRVDLEQSRGADSHFNEVSSKICDFLTEGNGGCARAGDDCTTCSIVFYTGTGSAGSGQYDPGPAGQGNCGNVDNGRCVTSGGGFSCYLDPHGDTTQRCTAPAGPPILQNIAGD